MWNELHTDCWVGMKTAFCVRNFLKPIGYGMN
jgi:hypothetical protein